MNHMKDVAEMLGLELNENFHFKPRLIDLSTYKFKFTEDYLMYYHTEGDYWEKASFVTLCNLLNGKYEVVKLSKQPSPILTEQERNYLSKVIKPFREKILHISKLSSKDGESICIDIRYDWEEDSIMLPKFATGTLYKGMEIGKEYSVKDLGL